MQQTNKTILKLKADDAGYKLVREGLTAHKGKKFYYNHLSVNGRPGGDDKRYTQTFVISFPRNGTLQLRPYLRACRTAQRRVGIPPGAKPRNRVGNFLAASHGACPLDDRVQSRQIHTIVTPMQGFRPYHRLRCAHSDHACA